MLSESQRELISFPTIREKLKGQSSSLDPELDLIYKPTDHKILGVLPEKQFIVSHVDAVNRVESVLTDLKLEAATVTDFKLLKNGSKLFAHYRLPMDGYSVDSGEEDDTLFPEIILRNGYDGKTVFGLEYGFWRQVCSNGARVLVMGQKSSRKTQVGDVDVEVIMNGVKQFVEQIVGSIYGKVMEMTNKSAENLPTELRVWLAGHVSDKLLGKYDERIEQEDLATLTQWKLFNIMTWLTTHQVHAYNRQRDLNFLVAKKFNFDFKLQ
jgi:hypothetical protein